MNTAPNTNDRLEPHVAAMAEAAHNLKASTTPELWDKFLQAYGDWIDEETTFLVNMPPERGRIEHQQGRVRLIRQLGMLLDTCTERLRRHRDVMEKQAAARSAALATMTANNLPR